MNRNIEIDITKGLLTIGMIFAHVVGLLYNQQSIPLIFLKHYIIDLVSFPGFLFCFGFTSWVAYYQKANIPWSKVAKTSLKIYSTFVISGVAWLTIVESKKIGFEVLAIVMTVRALPLLSEFLFTFAAMTLLGVLFRRYITIATERWQHILLSIAFFLLFTLLPVTKQTDPLISIFIGGGMYNSFPIIQYLPLFLLGVFAARFTKWFSLQTCIFGAVIGLGLWFLFMIFQPPHQFPPSASWIINSVGFLSIIYGFAKIINEKFPAVLVQYLNQVGQNVLVYLLLSNLIIMISVALGIKSSLNEIQVFLFVVTLLVLIFFIQYISVDLHRANQYIEKTG